VQEAEWIDFARNRTEALQMAQTWSGADWIFTIDADMTLEGIGDGDTWTGLPRLEPMESPARVDLLHLRVEPADAPGLIFYQPHFMRADLAWRWEGVYHEGLAKPRDDIVGFKLHEPHLLHHADSSASADPEGKFRRAYDLLLAEHQRDPDNPRTLFYLARTAHALVRWQPFRWLEALRLFHRRAMMDGHDE
jgi:hypothetical protein